CQLRKYSG
ncbi:hypothetical protein CEXT_38121, partial [Caerostris extrusa]